jgi:hypothetical protein
MKPHENKICYTCVVNSFEESFTEYKRRMALSQLYLILSFLLFALAIVFSFMSITIAAMLLLSAFNLFLISKRHFYVASIAERFIINN